MKKKFIIVLITIGLIAFVIITSFNETTYNESKKSGINRNSKIEDIVLMIIKLIFISFGEMVVHIVKINFNFLKE